MPENTNSKLKKRPLINTFSANSLKILNKNPEAFKLKYEAGLSFNTEIKSAKAGQNLHSYICYYLKGFNMAKIEASASDKDRAFLEKIKTNEIISTLKAAENKDIEQPFYVKCPFSGENTGCFYLTGRFDAVLKQKDNMENSQIQIYDWKTTNLPKDSKDDIQTTVYLLSASKLYKTTSVSITYLSLTLNQTATVLFDPAKDYQSIISNIIRKYTL